MYLETSLSIFIFALVPIAVKYTQANPFEIGFVRLLITFFLLGLLWRKKIQWEVIKSKKFGKLVLLGTCFFFHWITYTFAIKWAGPSLTVLGLSTYGIQLLIWGSLFLGNKIHTKTLVCLLFILIGVFLVIPNWDFANESTLGLLIALVSATFYSLIPIILQKSKEISTETRIYFQFFIAFIGYALFLGQMNFEVLVAKDWYALIFLAVFATFIAHTLWAKVTAVIPTTTTAIIYYLVTPITMLLSRAIYNEQLSAIQITGALIILVASLSNLVNKKMITQFFK